MTDFSEFLNYGFTPSMIPDDAIGVPARITATHKDRYELVCDCGVCFGRLKTSVYYGYGFEEFPTTGDFVMIDYNPQGDSQIIKTLERKSFFSRRDPGPIPREQAVAANFDYVFIMQSLNHDFNGRRLERYLTVAWQSGGIPVVILTKADLIEDYSKQMKQASDIASGAYVCAVSAVTGYGLELLSEYLKPRKTIAFLGSSGVGKSSLLNALAGEELMAVKEIREDDSKGRHTTTHRQLIMLQSGVMVIDTPGMRELGMWDVSEGLGETFADVEKYLGKCKFSDCKHTTEPNCAIKAAIESGELPRERWNSYIQIKREAKFSDDKISQRRAKQERNKAISKHGRQMKKKYE